MEPRVRWNRDGTKWLTATSGVKWPSSLPGENAKGELKWEQPSLALTYIERALARKSELRRASESRPRFF